MPRTLTALAATDDRAAGMTFNVAGENMLGEAEWISEIAAVVGWEGEVVAAPSELLPDYLREDSVDLRQDFVLDTSRIRRVLGYRELVDRAVALRRTIDWERANPPERPAHPDFVDRFDYDAEDAALTRIRERD